MVTGSMIIKMATGGKSVSNYSVIETSDMIYDFSCSPCTKNGNNSEALYRCVECKIFLCTKCRDGHKQFVIGHKIVDVRAKDIGGGLVHLKGYTCDEHPDKLIEMYCKTHDEVYCSVCIMQHRSCTGVDYIPDIAKKLLEKQDKESVEIEFKQQCVELQKLKHSRLKYLSKLSEDKDKSTQDIKGFKEKMIQNAEEMEKMLLLEVEKRFKKMTDDVKLDMEKIDQLIDDVKKYLSKIIADKYDDDKDEVVTFRLSERQIIAANKQILDLAWKKERMVHFQPSTTLENCLDQKCFGNFKISRRNTDAVNIYNLDTNLSECINLEAQLTSYRILSKHIEKLGDVDAEVLTVCVVSRYRSFIRLKDELKKGQRHKVFVLCLVTSIVRQIATTYFKAFGARSAEDLFSHITVTEDMCKRFCTEKNIPYICISSRNQDVLKAVQLIKKNIDEK